MLSGSEVTSTVSALRWVTVMIACVFAADAAVDGSVRSVLAIALVAAVAVAWTLRERAVDRYQDMAATLVIAAAAVIAEPSAAFIPAILMSLLIMLIEPQLTADDEIPRPAATSAATPEPPSTPEPTPSEPAATLAARRAAESLSAQSEVDDDVRNRSARVAERTAEWLTFTKIGLDRHLSIRPDPRLSELRDDVQGAIEEVGHRVDHLRMTVGDDTSLGQHLRGQLRWWKKHYVAKTTLTIDDETRRLSHDVEQTLLGIAQEAFDNAGRYAQADHLEVRWEVADEAATLSIADDGVGFDLEGTRATGIDAMERAAARIDAEFSLTSVLGVGTAISVRIDTP